MPQYDFNTGQMLPEPDPRRGIVPNYPRPDYGGMMSLGQGLPDPGVPGGAGTGMALPNGQPESYPGQASEIPTPHDFWSRLAQGAGMDPFHVQLGRHPSGLEVILALAAGLGNFKANQGAQRVLSTEEKNKLIRQSTSDMATRRWELRKARLSQEAMSGRSEYVQGRLDERQGKSLAQQQAISEATTVPVPGMPGKRAPLTAVAGATPYGQPLGSPLAGTNKPPGGGGTPKPKSSTGAERQTLAFYNRAKQAVDTLTQPYSGGQSLEQRMAAANALRQSELQYAPNMLKTSEQRQYRQAQRAFTEARLRKESGAAISKSEYENDSKIYFAQPGDDPKTIQQKEAARQTVLEGLKFGSGPAYQEFYGDQAPAGKIVVVAPDGSKHPFDTQEQADRFKKLAGIK